MAGVGAREIKRKIRSVNSTMQITKAMELVSTAKLKKTRTNMERTRPFFHEILSTVGNILSFNSVDKHDFMKREQVNSTLIILITSDRGLCGGYNSNAIKQAEALVKATPHAKFVTIGKKGSDYFSKRGYEVLKQYTKLTEYFSYRDAAEIGSYCVDLFLNKEVDEIKIVYTKMVSTLSQEPQVLSLIPVDEITHHEASDLMKTKYKDDNLNYEPSVEAVMNYLVPKYVESVIYGALSESSASEQASRRNAMENATNNAQDMIDSLVLTYNQARQGAITQELTEIVAGANALEG